MREVSSSHIGNEEQAVVLVVVLVVFLVEVVGALQCLDPGHLLLLPACLPLSAAAVCCCGGTSRQHWGCYCHYSHSNTHHTLITTNRKMTKTQSRKLQI